MPPVADKMDRGDQCEWRNYEDAFRPVRERLGTRPLQSITKADIEDLMDWMLTAGRRPQARRQAGNRAIGPDGPAHPGTAHRGPGDGSPGGQASPQRGATR